MFDGIQTVEMFRKRPVIPLMDLLLEMPLQVRQGISATCWCQEGRHLCQGHAWLLEVDKWRNAGKVENPLKLDAPLVNNPKEAFNIWLQAYSNNYTGTGFVTDPKTVAEQAWQARGNYEDRKKENEKKYIQRLLAVVENPLSTISDIRTEARVLFPNTASERKY